MKGWLFASPRRFYGALLLLAALLCVAYTVFAPSPDRADDGQAQAPSPKPSATLSATPTTSDPDLIPVSPRQAATEAARAYVQAFFSKGGSTAAWHRRIDQYSTTTLAYLNADVPRSSVPDVYLRSLWVTGIKPDYAEVKARMSDGMVLDVAVVIQGGQWRVNEFAPA